MTYDPPMQREGEDEQSNLKVTGAYDRKGRRPRLKAFSFNVRG